MVGDEFERASAAERKLGVAFEDVGLLRVALVHSSYINEAPDRASESNERLEFLGDAVLGAVVAEELYRERPELREGSLTQRRAAVIQGSTLARVARDLSLGDCLLMGRGEEAAGGRERDSNLENAFEAVVGALFLDQGYVAARHWVLSKLDPHMNAPDRKSNPKSALQEALQARGLPLPEYRIAAESGEDHARTFTAEVLVKGRTAGTGSGPRKVVAENEAASVALESLENEPA